MTTLYSFYYVDGPVGSHKTTSLLNHLRHTPVPATIGTQTNNLSGQYQNADNLDIEMICREVHTNGEFTAASKTYRERLKSDPLKNYAVNQKVAIDCQDAGPDRTYFFDEIPSVFETFKFNSLPLSQDFVSGWLASEWSDAPDYYLLVANDHIRNIANNSWKDDLLKDCEDIITVASRIASDDYRVYVNAKQFNAFKNGLPRQLQFFVVARPSLYPANSTFIGANFDNSLMSQIWSVSEDVEFVAHPSIKAKRTHLGHKAGLTTIYYVSERNFSKKLFDQKVDGIKSASKPTAFPKIAKATGKAIDERFPDDKFIYCSNTEYEKTKWAGKNGISVSSNSRGWNGARDINMSVYLAAINYDPASVTFLYKLFGIDRERAKYALTFESAYQFAGRTSLRMDGSNQPITLIFGDRATAKAIASFIPGCAEPQLLDIGIPELLFSDEEEADEGEIEPVVEKSAEDVKAETQRWNQLRNRRNLIKENHAATHQYQDFSLRFWGHYSSLETVEADTVSWNEFLGFLEERTFHSVVEIKEHNLMFREGEFFDNNNHLLKDNIRSSKLIVLDIDKISGDVTELSKYLKSKQVTHAVVSTHGCVNVENYSEQQMKIRIFIPLNEAVDAENYSRIIRLLNQDIRTKFGDQFIVDPACMSINNRFYGPCRPAKGEPIFIDGTYFEYDLTRFMKQDAVFLDAKTFMLRNLPEDLQSLTIKRHIAGSVRKTAEQIVIECASMASPGNGDVPFYNAAVELIKAGYSADEAVAALTGREKMFGSGQGRNAERAVASVVAKQRIKLAA